MDWSMIDEVMREPGDDYQGVRCGLCCDPIEGDEGLWENVVSGETRHLDCYDEDDDE